VAELKRWAKKAMDTQTIISVIGLLGVGGLISGYLTIIWQRRSASQQQKEEYKAARYKCTLVLMFGYLEGPTSLPKLNAHVPRPFRSHEEVLEEVKTEWLNMILFASDDVMKELQEFVLAPSDETYFKTALAMRRDLWGGRMKFSHSDVRLKIK
jgi:hypothetical protein